MLCPLLHNRCLIREGQSGAKRQAEGHQVGNRHALNSYPEYYCSSCGNYARSVSWLIQNDHDHKSINAACIQGSITTPYVIYSQETLYISYMEIMNLDVWHHF